MGDDHQAEVVDEEVLKVEAVVEPDVVPDKPKKANIFKLLLAKKKVLIPLLVLAVIGIILAVPVTRYRVLGTFIKADYYVTVVDSVSYKTVSGVSVSLGGQTLTSNDQLKFRVGVGKHKLTAGKKYYKDFSEVVNVPFKQGRSAHLLAITPTGRQTPIKITNKISGKQVDKVTIKVADTQATTDEKGEVIISLPPDQKTLQATLTAEGYNDSKVTITVDDQLNDKNTFQMVPKGKIYFLSKLSGKIDVVKTDLDGGNRATVLVGTGREEDRGTVLLATRDWKYLALQSRREGDKARLYLIDTSNDKLTEIDSGDATFTPVGWNDHAFIYTVYRNNLQIWQPKNSALKSYNAETTQLTTIDETLAEGSNGSDYASERLENVYVVKNDIIYTKRWESNYYSTYLLATKRTGIYTAKPSGTSKQLLKDFDAGTTSYITAVLSEPAEIYYSINNYTTNIASYYEYLGGKISENKDIKTDDFSKFYPTYLQSPGGQKTFWYEPRDGKNSLFVGTSNGDGGNPVIALSEYVSYGWYSDDYLLVSKNSSELYILPVGGPVDKSLKVTDFHRPDKTFLGYGGGYGGQ